MLKIAEFPKYFGTENRLGLRPRPHRPKQPSIGLKRNIKSERIKLILKIKDRKLNR